MTLEGDVVLVHIESEPAFFARIESITADVKPEWFQVKMLVLQIPLIVVTWILREPYINGEEFTMGGRPVKLVKVVAPEEKEEEMEQPSPEKLGEAPEERQKSKGPPEGESKVVSLADRRRKNHSS